MKTLHHSPPKISSPHYHKPSAQPSSKPVQNYVQLPSNHGGSAPSRNTGAAQQQQKAIHHQPRKPSMDEDEDSEVELLSISSGDEDDRAVAAPRGRAARSAREDEKAWDGEEPNCWKRVDEAEGVDAEGSIFHNATLRECEFTRANLRGALLAGAHLQSANLQDACLIDCSFCGSDLRSAHLQTADLTNANLEGANLEGANLKVPGCSWNEDVEAMFRRKFFLVGMD